MGDFTVMALSLSVVCLTWAVVKVNEKVESVLRLLKRFDRPPVPPHPEAEQHQQPHQSAKTRSEYRR